jgi:ferredoxin
MVKLKIDNIECEAPDGSTLLTAAKSIGIIIPTLCHKEGLPHYSSCMVCMVKDNKSNSFIPSCSALVQPEMDIDASGNEVISIRKKAVELLLSEHRAECEAPCRIVCPAGYNIPLMNRLLGSEDLEKAIQLTLSELDSGEIFCEKCSAYCENACRRKKIDNPVSIRNLKLFVSRNIKPEDKALLFPADLNQEKKIKRFSSHIGKLIAGESDEWLKETNIYLVRSRDLAGNHSAFYEAQSCMHCDCRASEDCGLRKIAEDYKIKDPGGKLVNAPIAKKINLQTNLIFENAKCIKCGLCVRVCADNNDDPPLCFINRGFVSIISEPLTCEFVETMKSTSDKCIDVCPTGALAYYE